MRELIWSWGGSSLKNDASSAIGDHDTSGTGFTSIFVGLIIFTTNWLIKRGAANGNRKIRG